MTFKASDHFSRYTTTGPISPPVPSSLSVVRVQRTAI